MQQSAGNRQLTKVKGSLKLTPNAEADSQGAARTNGRPQDNLLTTCILQLQAHEYTHPPTHTQTQSHKGKRITKSKFSAKVPRKLHFRMPKKKEEANNRENNKSEKHEKGCKRLLRNKLQRFVLVGRK